MPAEQIIDLYSWSTMNGHKVQIMLEETGLSYNVHPVNIRIGQQFSPEFLKISPNNKIPAIVDRCGPGGRPYSLFESGAILLYLAEKFGVLLPHDTGMRYVAIQWLMFQVSSFGPMLGQAHFFLKHAPIRISYATHRYRNEANRLYAILDRRLGEEFYLAGDYSVADIAAFPWARAHDRQGIDLAEYPNVARWLARIEQRSAVKRGLALLEHLRDPRPMSEDDLRVLYGDEQYRRR